MTHDEWGTGWPNLDIIKTASWMIDLGLESPSPTPPSFSARAKNKGGAFFRTVVAMGTPEEVAAVEGSWTGRYLRGVLAPKAEPAASYTS